ncbi:MAG: hypothetical protein EHM13_02450 [Acidobacteria bacterium]|nr:MAG: hypothetical protein EHM13_02450 [Acidobacteriota bacterium]
MRPLARVAFALILACGLAAVLAACKHTVGPSLTVVIEGRRLEPSSTVPNAANICCCRVRGTIRNTSTIAVNVEVRFHSKDSAGKDLGTALDWVPNIPAGASKTFDAPGIIALCSQVATIDNDPIAYGLYDGPR